MSSCRFITGGSHAAKQAFAGTVHIIIQAVHLSGGIGDLGRHLYTLVCLIAGHIKGQRIVGVKLGGIRRFTNTHDDGEGFALSRSKADVLPGHGKSAVIVSVTLKGAVLIPGIIGRIGGRVAANLGICVNGSIAVMSKPVGVHIGHAVGISEIQVEL